MKKLDVFKQDILHLLESIEPQTLTYRDMKEQLAPNHKSKYKDDRVYGAALAYHLNWLLGKRLIRKNEETLEWGTPKADFSKGKKEPSTPEHTSLWKQAREEFMKIRNAMINKDPDQLVEVPEAMELLLDTYPFLNEQMKSQRIKLANQINLAYKVSIPDPYFRTIRIHQRLRTITQTTVREILREVFRLLHES